jgi:small subunit ribosomal protein S18
MPPFRSSRPTRPQRRRPKNRIKVVKQDPIFVEGQRPRPMYVDYKDLELLSKLINRQGKIVSRRKTGCHASSQHAVASAVKRARFMALLPYVAD